MKKIIHKIITLIILLTGMMNVINATQVTHEKYAVIINAESDKSDNHIRYWNDCSAIYQTLLLRGFPGTNIYVAMSDGHDTDGIDDITLENGQYDSSELDLNGDGYDDIEYAATRDDIEYIFHELSGTMTSDDDLFIYTVGEGGVSVYNSALPSNPHPDSIYPYRPVYTNYLVLWDEDDRLTDAEFAQLLEPIHARTINIVMQQSYSGGFIDNLHELHNIVITTACGIDEVSYAMTNQKYDEFTYLWCCAVNGFSPFYLYPYYLAVSCPNDADINEDGYVTMYEAYSYVRNHDTKGEYAIIESNPDCLKSSLSLNAILDCLLIPGWDLCMKDNYEDTGEEPNLTTPDSWLSDDIWFEENGQRTEELLPGETYDVCVKVWNRGEETSPGNAKLYVHWAKATIGGAWPWGWLDQYTYDCGGNTVRRGGVIDSVVLPPIDGGEEYIARIPWTTPDITDYLPCFGTFGYNQRELMHYCILARIVDSQEQPDESITNIDLAEFIFNYNNVVSRNVILMAVENDGNSLYIPGGVDITNPRPGENSGPYTLTCLIDGEDDDWEHMASVRLTFDSQFMNSQPYMTWSNCYPINNQYGSFYLEDGALFEEIYFGANDNNQYNIMLSIEDLHYEGYLPAFTIYLVLRNENGFVVNGEKFEFRHNYPDLANIIRRPTYTEEPENEIEQQPLIQEEALSIDVYNAQGMHLMHCDNCNVHSLNLPEGIYIYRVQGENKSYTIKFIK